MKVLLTFNGDQKRHGHKKSNTIILFGSAFFIWAFES